MRRATLIASSIAILAAFGGIIAATKARAQSEPDALKDFAVVQKVLQHPRCQNCHIPGDAPLQFDEGLPHQMRVVRGERGLGVAALPCGTCHNTVNPSASFGPHAPPGAPNWRLPSPD